MFSPVIAPLAIGKTMSPASFGVASRSSRKTRALAIASSSASLASGVNAPTRSMCAPSEIQAPCRTGVLLDVAAETICASRTALGRSDTARTWIAGTRLPIVPAVASALSRRRPKTLIRRMGLPERIQGNWLVQTLRGVYETQRSPARCIQGMKRIDELRQGKCGRCPIRIGSSCLRRSRRLIVRLRSASTMHRSASKSAIGCGF